MPQNHSFKFYQIEISQDGLYYVSFSQPDKRYSSVKRVQFISLTLYKIYEGGRLEYIAGKCHDIRDLFIEAPLKENNFYLAVVNFAQDPSFSYTETASLNVYGPK